jgi:hypothetical protein
MTDSIGTPSDAIISGRQKWIEDEPFIYSTWRNGLFYGSLNKENFPPAEQFFREYTARIKQILALPKDFLDIRVACIQDAPEVIIGYAVFTGDLHLEWVYVKDQFRGKGVARFLTVRTKTVSPELTKSGAAIVKKKNLTVKWSQEDETTN